MEEYSQSQRNILASIACHNSYRFGDSLNKYEMRGLIDSIHKLKGSFNCPHGRPILIGIANFS